MLNAKPLDKLIFLDIETVPRYKSFFDMSENLQELFLRKFKQQSEEMLGIPIDTWDVPSYKLNEEMSRKIEDFYNNRAALHAEFCQIVCISIGKIKSAPLTDPDPSTVFDFKVTSYKGDNELTLLTEFATALSDVLYNPGIPKYAMVAFNGNVFDFPVIAKRMIFNDIALPPYFDVDGKKPWDIAHLIDPKITWKWNVYDFNASLALLCELFGVPTSKDDIDGSQVRNVFYEENDVNRIAVYCEKDVVALALLYLRMKQLKNNLNVVTK